MMVSTYVAKFLKEKGVSIVFGYDGSMMLKLADEISLVGGIRYLQSFHEQGAAFAANAYSRITGNIGVALVTSGPGVINSLAGVVDAYMDSVPFMLITGNDRYSHMKDNPGVRLSGFQDMDVVGITSVISKYSVQIKDPNDTLFELEKAWRLANEGRKGPVVVDIPMDVQFADIDKEYLKMQIGHITTAQSNADISGIDEINDDYISAYDDTINRIVDMLKTASRPVILAGGGIRLSSSEKSLKNLASHTGIPVITTLNGYDSYYDKKGFSGLYGMPSCNLALKEADIILAMGVRFGNRQVGKIPSNYTSAKIIHIDCDNKELGRVFQNEIKVEADLSTFLPKLTGSIISNVAINCSSLSKWNDDIKCWHDIYDSYVYINNDGLDPVKIVRSISDIAAEDTIYTNDVGQNEMWVCQGLKLHGNQRLLSSSGYGSMGFSLPAGIGACIADNTCNVISFMGDGGFQMNMQELQFIRIHNLNIKVVVFNNNTLGMMRDVQRLYYNNHFLGSDTDLFSCPDLKIIADAYDMEYLRVETYSILEYIADYINNDKACIIDCRISMDSKVANWNEFLQCHRELGT